MPSRVQEEFDQNSKEELYSRLQSARGKLAGKSRAYNYQKKKTEEWRVAAKFIADIQQKLVRSARRYAYSKGEADGFKEGTTYGMIVGSCVVAIFWLLSLVL